MVIAPCSECLVGTIQSPVASQALSMKSPLQPYKQGSALTPFDKVLIETELHSDLSIFHSGERNATLQARGS